MSLGLVGQHVNTISLEILVNKQDFSWPSQQVLFLLCP